MTARPADPNAGRAVLARHQPHPDVKGRPFCAWCVKDWPCDVQIAYQQGLADANTPAAGQPEATADVRN